MAYKRVTEEERTLIYRRGQEGQSQSEITRRPGPRRFTDQVRADAEARLKEGWTPEMIGERARGCMRISPVTLRHGTRKLGLQRKHTPAIANMCQPNAGLARNPMEGRAARSRYAVNFGINPSPTSCR